MSQNPTDDTLCRRWLHAHEEDTSREMVYRPATFAFPPARGRMGFEFRPDGSAVWIAIGRGDVPVQAVGVWQYDENRKVLQLQFEAAPDQQLEVVALAPDRLVIRRP